MSQLSRSKAPKSKREPYKPKEELRPDPTDYFRSASYIDQRAAMGEFKGSPGRETGTVAVLHYLWRHTLRDKSLERSSKGRELYGCVLSGKSKLAKIAADTCLSYSTVQRAVDGLIRAGWLEFDYRDDQTMILKVRMDMDGHRYRLSLLEEGVVSQTTGVVTQTTGVEGCGRTDHRVLSEGQQGAVPQTTPPGQSDHTIQGSTQGSDRATNSGNSAEGSVTVAEDLEGQGQDQNPGDPSAQDEDTLSDSSAKDPDRPSVEDLRAHFLAYVREHASQGNGVRPSQAFDTIGIFATGGELLAVVDPLHKNGVICPTEGGWCVPDAA